MLKLKSYAAQTHQGPYLALNEDALEIDLKNNLFMLLDGFGGTGIGDKCVQEVMDSVKSFFSKVSESPDSTMPFYFSKRYLIEENYLINALYYAHHILCKQNFKKEMEERAGSSIISAVLSDNLLIMASVGNCNCYLYRKGRLEKIVKEESIKYVSGEEGPAHFSSIPTSALGLFDEIDLRCVEIRLKKDDLFLMLTDGAYGRLDKSEIRYFVEQNQLDLQEKIQNMFDLANNRGNLDNQSAIFLRF